MYAGTQAHAALLKQMLLAARQTVALVDGSKLGRTGVARIGGLGELDCLVTERFVDPLLEKEMTWHNVSLHVHLMVEAPASFIPALLDAGADAFSLHPETICREAFRVINMLRQAGKEVGMVLNPATPVESIQHYLHLLDKVTVMTVDPGYAGQPFIPEMLAKITQLHQLKETGSLRFLLEVDGSCNRNTYRALLGAGAQILVMGSSGLFRADMPLELAWETMSRELSAALHSPELV